MTWEGLSLCPRESGKGYRLSTSSTACLRSIVCPPPARVMYMTWEGLSSVHLQHGMPHDELLRHAVQEVVIPDLVGGDDLGRVIVMSSGIMILWRRTVWRK